MSIRLDLFGTYNIYAVRGNNICYDEIIPTKHNIVILIYKQQAFEFNGGKNRFSSWTVNFVICYFGMSLSDGQTTVTLRNNFDITFEEMIWCN